MMMQMKVCTNILGMMLNVLKQIAIMMVKVTRKVMIGKVWRKVRMMLMNL